MNELVDPKNILRNSVDATSEAGETVDLLDTRVVEDLARVYGASQDDNSVLTERQRDLLNKAIPASAYVTHERNGETFRYVPAYVIDYIAERIFGDNWSTDVLEDSIIFEGRTAVRFQDADSKAKVVETTVYRIVSRAKVRVTVTGRQGRQVHHTAIGVASVDVKIDSTEIHDAYKIALKGAVTDGKRTALKNFGRAFGMLERDSENNIIKRIREEQRQRQEANDRQSNLEALASSQDARADNGSEVTTPARGYQVGKTGDAKVPAVSVKGYELYDAQGSLVEASTTVRGYMEALQAMVRAARTSRTLEALDKVNRDTYRRLGQGPQRNSWRKKAEEIFSIRATELRGGAVKPVATTSSEPAAQPSTPADTATVVEAAVSTQAADDTADGPAAEAQVAAQVEADAEVEVEVEVTTEPQDLACDRGSQGAPDAPAGQEAADNSAEGPGEAKAEPTVSANDIAEPSVGDAASEEPVPETPSEDAPNEETASAPASGSDNEAAATDDPVIATDEEVTAVPAASVEPTEAESQVQQAEVEKPARKPRGKPGPKPKASKVVSGSSSATPAPAVDLAAAKPMTMAAAGETKRLRSGIYVVLNAKRELENVYAFGQALVEAIKRAQSVQEINETMVDAKPYMRFLKPSTVSFIEQKSQRRFKQLSVKA